MTTLDVPPAEAAAEEKKPRSRTKVLAIALVVLLLAGGAWWFLHPKGPSTPQPGQIMTLDSTQINLAGGHYLKIGLALQLTTDAKEVDGSKALDDTIDLFSGRDLGFVSKALHRRELKSELVRRLGKDYDGDVMGVYFTEFVTQ